MLDSFQRQTVEATRGHKGRVSITLHEGTVLLEDNGTTITVGNLDRKLNHDIALALQDYYNRQNNK